MKINTLTVKQFRNYREENVSFGTGVNVFYGNNAQGKTNLLEAVYLFSGGKSHRGTPDKSLIQTGTEEAKLNLSFSSENREMEGEIHLFLQKRKEIRLSGAKLQKNSDLSRFFHCVLFVPEELNLIKEGPDLRRQLLDRAISALRPSYENYLNLYKIVLRQKSMLLKKADEQPHFMKTLPIWNEKLADLGARIIFYRNSYIQRMAPFAAEFQSEMTGGKEQLRLSYLSQIEPTGEINEIKEKLLDRMNGRQAEEIASKQVLIGPHRDDLAFFLNEEPAKIYASQGQQRTMVLAVKLAEMRVIAGETGEPPVLLLDDIMSELDASRREFLVGQIKDCQVILTCTDKDRTEEIPSVTYFYVEEGRVTHVS